MRRLAIAALLVLAVVATVKPANASSCFAFNSFLDFGTIDMLSGTPHDTSDTTLLLCFRNNPTFMVRACVHMGYNQADATQRYMDNGSGDLLGFQIYKDAARTSVWGSADVPIPIYNTYGPVTLDFAPGTFIQLLPVYGRVFSGQPAVPQGTYTSGAAGTAIGFSVKSEEYPSAAAAASCNAITTNSFGHTSTARAAVQSTCNVTSTAMDFGIASTLTSAIDTSATIQVSCTAGASYFIALNGGNAGATDPTMRQMSLGAQNVTYGIYRNAARTQGWGSLVGTNTVAGSMGGSGINSHTAYGRVPAQATPGTGTYTDTIVVTLTY
ncbi:MAG: spore coat U domain-containing protein [Pseudomonadota bacterium]